VIKDGAVKTTVGHVRLVNDRRGAAKMLDPLRLRILERLRTPDSAAGIARLLRMPRQKINYHLRELEKHGFVEHVEERRKGNCVERLFQSTARHYLILPQTLGELALDPEQLQDRFSSSYLIAVASQAIAELGELRQRAEASGKKLATLTLQNQIAFASAADRTAFTQELSREIARLIRKFNRKTNNSRSFKLFFGIYPAITRKEQRNEQDTES